MTVLYPLAALEALTDRRTGRPVRVEPGMKARHPDGVSFLTADRLAVQAGYHPAEVWPSWFEDALADVGHTCDGCAERFVPSRPFQRYCSERCRTRLKMRRYRTNPQVLEKARIRSAAYYEECAPTVRWKKQRRTRRPVEEVA